MMLLSQTPNYQLAEKVGLDIVAMKRHYQTLVAKSISLATAHDNQTVIRKAVTTHCGTLIEPVTTQRTAEVQLSMIDVSVSGTTVANAGRQWVKAVNDITAKYKATPS